MYRDVVDDLHQRAEPGLLQVGGEALAQRQIHRRCDAAAVALDELVDLAQHHLLDVATAGKRLAHARGIDVEMDRRRLTGQHGTLGLNLTSSKGDHASECE